MAWSSVGQAGYMLAGVVVSTRLGVQATVFYVAVYLVMNVAAFAVIVARERETALGDDIAAFRGLGAASPLLAGAMTLAMLGLAGIPATAGFIGKFYVIDATVDGDYTWLGIVIVDRLDDLAGLLPAGGGRDVDAGAGGRAGARRHGAPGAGRRLRRGRRRGRAARLGGLRRRGACSARPRSSWASCPRRSSTSRSTRVRRWATSCRTRTAMADQSDRPEPDHSGGRPPPGHGRRGLPRDGAGGHLRARRDRTGTSREPEAERAGADRAPGTSAPEEGDPGQATGNPDAAGG
jgi:hypothetical protein